MPSKSLPYLFVPLIASLLTVSCASFKYDEAEADRLYEMGKVEEAQEHYDYLARFGLIKAKRKLGNIQLKQNDELEAMKWFEQGASAGDVQSKISRARLLVNSEVPQIRDTARGTNELIELVYLGNNKAARDLLKLYLSEPTILLPAGYIEFLMSKAEAGHPSSCYLLAEYSQGLDKQMVQELVDDPVQTTNLYSCALEAYPKAVLGMASYLDQHPEIDGFPLLLAAFTARRDARMEDFAARIARQIEKEQYDNWTLFHAEQLHIWLSETRIDSFYDLAKLYMRNPQLGKSTLEISEFVTQCKEAGNQDCAALEADIHLNGKGVVKDPWKAEALLDAIEVATPYVNYLKGMLYASGFLGEPHFGKALKHLNAAAVEGFYQADRELFTIYTAAAGVSVDYVTAFKHGLLSKFSDEFMLELKNRYDLSDAQFTEAQRAAAVEQIKRTELSHARAKVQ